MNKNLISQNALEEVLNLTRFGPTKGNITMKLGLRSDVANECVLHLLEKKLVTVINSAGLEMIYITKRGLRVLGSLK